MFKKLFLIGILLFLPLVCLAEGPEDELGRSDYTLLVSTGKIDSYKFPGWWRMIQAAPHNRRYKSTMFKEFHPLFSVMHEYEEKYENRYVEKENVVGYKIWYNADPDNEGPEEERKWKFKILVCDWEE